MHSVECIEDFRCERGQEGQGVALRSNEHNAQAASAEILLKSQTTDPL
jgi:hypothetical protein